MARCVVQYNKQMHFSNTIAVAKLAGTVGTAGALVHSRIVDHETYQRPNHAITLKQQGYYNMLLMLQNRVTREHYVRTVDSCA